MINRHFLFQQSLSFIVLVLGSVFAPTLADDAPRTSKTIGAVLREPLPPEELVFSQNDAEFTITGPTFAYHVQKTTGVIAAMRTLRDGRPVIETRGPADIQIDQYRLGSELNSCKVSVVSQGKDKIVLKVEGTLCDPGKSEPVMDYTIIHTFFNDGVVVSAVKLSPREDLLVEKAIVHRLSVQGQFSHYLHKRRDENGMQAARGRLPEAGQTVRLAGLTSCWQVFSHTAGLAIFTDCGATHLSRPNLDTAVVDVTGVEDGRSALSLAQYLVHVAPGDKPYVLKAGNEFSFRVGISVAPNRLPHPRMHDLRMFTWVGDAKFPYPTDEEIADVAKLGFTLFQMHRAGTPGEPRPPAGEAQRVAKKVHQSGMLFLWAVGADLIYRNAPGVQKLMAEGKWPLWQGFNYGGRYTASMDPYCDLAAVCLGAPNGLADYRLACIRRMMEQLPVDGLFLDDNLAYANCTLWKEHGHPQKVYDCLIELHDMNWRRRQLMRSMCPHVVLISHCTKAFVLPVICDFDALLYGEGYSFGSMENYWDYYVASCMNLHAQGMLYAGDSEPDRCGVTLAFNYDLITGGGQYASIDWRLYPKKFPYAAGVSDREPLYVKTYNLAQYYFGMYESTHTTSIASADLFSTIAPDTYATVYRNRVWDEYLIALANMSRKTQQTSLEIRSPEAIGIMPKKEYTLFNVHRRTATPLRGDQLDKALRGISIPGESIELFCLRQPAAQAPYHLWGGKRISEVWDAKARKLTLLVQGPPDLRETVYIGTAKHGVQRVAVAGNQAAFFFDPDQHLAHGTVTFTAEPLTVEVICSSDGINRLPEKSLEHLHPL